MFNVVTRAISLSASQVRNAWCDVINTLGNISRCDSSRIGRPMALRQTTAERGGSRGATAAVGRAVCGLIVELPVSFLSVLKAEFFSLAHTGLETALLAGRPHRGMECRQRLWMSMSGSSSGDG